jgi:hypothetical protein
LRRVLAVVLACGLFAAAPSAAAAEDPSTRKKVQTYLDLATDLFKSGDFEGALAELRRAEGLSDLAVVRYNIGRCLEQLHKDVEAVAAYETYLAIQDTTDGATERQRKAKEAVTRLAASQPFGTLEVACPAGGSTVMVVGLMPAPVPCPWRSDHVAVGIYDVQTQAPAFTRTQIAANKTTALIAPLAPAPNSNPNPNNTKPNPTLPNPPPPVHGVAEGSPVTLHLVAERDGDLMNVMVDSSPALACQAPCQVNVPGGRHRITVSGDATYSDTVSVYPNGPSTAKLGRRRAGFTALGVSSVVVGGVGFLVGLGWLGYVATYNGANPYAAQLNYAPPAALLAVGAGVAIVGGVVGFKLAGRNTVEMTASREVSPPQLLSLGVAPVRGGGVAGATFSF